MTEKINSIPTFQTVMAPMKPSPCTDGAFVAVGGKFAGKDLAQTGIPQNHGITTPAQVLALFDA